MSGQTQTREKVGELERNRLLDLLHGIDWSLVRRYQGEVEETELHDRPGEAAIIFEGTSRRWFPLSQLEAIGAAFPTAQVEHSVYAAGSLFISELRYIGPSREELVDEAFEELAREEIADLEDVELWPSF